MPQVRNPNTGPYVVTWRCGTSSSSQECQTWADATAVMRTLLIDGYEEVSVRFA